MLSFIHRHAAWTATRCLCRLKSLQKCIGSPIHTSWSVTGRSLPELTAVRYPKITRGNFGTLSAADIEFFQKLLSDPGQVLTEDDDLTSYNVDWMGNYRGDLFFWLFLLKCH